MKILVLGGTTFLGRHLIKLALEAGHDVTTFNRGQSAPELFKEVCKLIGDRSSDLAALSRGNWDVVYDLSGYRPEEVRATVALLRARIERYVFVSTISVYLDSTAGSVDESAAIYQQGAGYGPLKALCEQEVLSLSGPTTGVVVRPGLIVGPFDPTYRFNYWLERVARGGAILAPGRPGRYIQIIDARDLAKFMIRLGDLPLGGLSPGDFPPGDGPSSNASGDTASSGAGNTTVGQENIFNTAGLSGGLSMGALLLAIDAIVRQKRGQEADPPARFVWVEDQELKLRSISEWTQLPLWIAEDGESASFYAVDSSKAARAGLTYSRIEDTIAAIYEEHPRLLLAGPQAQPGNDPGDPRRQPAISAALEEAILAELTGSV